MSTRDSFSRSSRLSPLMGLAGGLLLLAVWCLGAWWARLSRTDLPPDVISSLYPFPDQVAGSFLQISTADIVQNIAISSTRVLAGFLAAATVAVPLGFLMGRFRFAARLAEPSNDFLRYLPVAGFTTILIFILGSGNASAIFVVFLGTVFHLTAATADAVRRVPPDYMTLARTLRMSPLKVTFRVVAPAAAPAIFDNLRISIGWAWSYVTLAEVIGSNSGLGHAIEVARRFIRIDQVFFWMIVIGVLGLASDQAMRCLGARLFSWSGSAAR